MHVVIILDFDDSTSNYASEANQLEKIVTQKKIPYLYSIINYNTVKKKNKQDVEWNLDKLDEYAIFYHSKKHLTCGQKSSLPKLNYIWGKKEFEQDRSIDKLWQ